MKMRKKIKLGIIYCLVGIILLHNGGYAQASEIKSALSFSPNEKLSKGQVIAGSEIVTEQQTKFGAVLASDEEREASKITDKEAIEDLLSLSELPQECRNILQETQHHIKAESGQIEQKYLLEKSEQEYNNGIMLLSDAIIVRPSIDLSKDGYFPDIINQESIGSCASCAVAYYQFTHEVNKLNNVKCVDETTTYSPLYPYNYLGWTSKGYKGTSLEENAKFLRLFGNVKLSELPYVESNYRSWNINDNARMKALNCRVSEFGSLELNTDVNNGGVPIISEYDDHLMILKSYLLTGHVLTYTTTSVLSYGACYKYSKNYPEYKVVYHAYNDSDAGHAMTIVGYDDNVWCDVNNNGKVDRGECGAFKVANSWGNNDDGAMNDGYFWILYDALNCVSVIPGFVNPAPTKTRIPAFSWDLSMKNIYYIMEVENHDVDVVGKVVYKVTSRDKTQVIPMLGSSPRSYITTMSGDLSGVFTWMYDYDLAINKFPISYAYGFKLNKGSGSADNVIYYMISLVDNKNNIIKRTNTVFDPVLGMRIPLQFTFKAGDVNYDGVVTQADLNKVNSYISKEIEFSNLQSKLSDIDNNGQINQSDVQLILEIILGIR